MCGEAVDHQAVMALMKRSPRSTAKSAFAMLHSRGGIYHSFSDWFKIRYNSLVAASSLGNCPRDTNSATKLGIQGLNGIGGLNDPPDFGVKVKNGMTLGPRLAPTLADGGITLTPDAGLECRQCLLGSRGIDGASNGLQGCPERLAIFPCYEIHRVAQQVDDAGLNRRFREDGGDGVGKALQGINDGQHDVLDAAVAQFVPDAQPELGASLLRQPLT
ncbi:hypothetical protein SAMN05518849_12541 [Sphingobium sp. AP50]|nr:hypothetical protein SAMN05518849_12541 [Sphingobium sp. AP50]